jgi:hypothetical protein
MGVLKDKPNVGFSGKDRYNIGCGWKEIEYSRGPNPKKLTLFKPFKLFCSPWKDS